MLVAADGYTSSVRSLCSESNVMGSKPTFQNRVYIWASLLIQSTHNFSQPIESIHIMVGKGSLLAIMQPEPNVVIATASQPVEDIETREYSFDFENETFRACSSGEELSKKQFLVEKAKVLPEYLQEYLREIKEDEMVLRGAYFHTPQTWSTACYGQGRIVFIGDSAHTFRPTGQGAAQAFEDSYHLARLVQQHGIECSLGEKLGQVREKRIRGIIEADQLAYQTAQKYIKDRNIQQQSQKFEQDEETHKFIQEANFDKLV
eukprot:TRINITY_DN12855_c0_g1_i11.p1 TRINITY_DN12855_c0_g1~~TRINITY_DN12855_c0_g1_i11.p1  ORF type:complete len:293 (+),score=24.39 TRINITY_DN12855_c0_g1_i11:99-881(+)